MKKLLLITTITLLGLTSCRKLTQKEYTVKVDIVGTPVADPYTGAYYNTVGYGSDHTVNINFDYKQTSYEITFKDDKRNSIQVDAISKNMTHIRLYQGKKLLKEQTLAIENRLKWTNAE